MTRSGIAGARFSFELVREVRLMAAPVVDLGGGVEFVEGWSQDRPDLSVILEEELPVEVWLSRSVLAARASITDELKAALEAHIKTAESMPELSGGAEAVLADIERTLAPYTSRASATARS